MCVWVGGRLDLSLSSFAEETRKLKGTGFVPELICRRNEKTEGSFHDLYSLEHMEGEES